MARRKCLAPGLRFHPTHVELVMYYLKRKVLGKKIHFEAIAEVDIYKFSPSDLPAKSCLESKDLEWYFFCPRQKKYATGDRVKRATEDGFWKKTGEDRSVHFNDRVVGTVKTLVFHSRPPHKGKRTDWVIHEYLIVDPQLAAAGVQLDSYVLCKVFRKNGPGPKNGAQYGAPFDESEWCDDDDIEAHVTPTYLDDPLPTMLTSAEKQTYPLVTNSFFHGSTSKLPLSEDPLPSSGFKFHEVLAGKSDDELACMLAAFTDDDTLPFDMSEINQDQIHDKGKNKCLPCPDGHDIYSGLDDLENLVVPMNLGHNFSEMQKDDHSQNVFPHDNLGYIELNDIYSDLDNLENLDEVNAGTLSSSGMQKDGYSWDVFPHDSVGYIELDDFQPSSNCLAGSYIIDQSPLTNKFAPSDQQNLQNFLDDSFIDMDPYSCVNQSLLLPDESYEVNNRVDVHPMFSNQFHHGPPSASQVLDVRPVQANNGIKLSPDVEIGAPCKLCTSRLTQTGPALTPTAAYYITISFYHCGGSSMHIKAEVTHRAGECTNDALLFMMEGSGSCWCSLQIHLLCLVHLVFVMLQAYGYLINCTANFLELLNCSPTKIFYAHSLLNYLYLLFCHEDIAGKILSKHAQLVIHRYLDFVGFLHVFSLFGSSKNSIGFMAFYDGFRSFRLLIRSSED